MGYCIDLMDVNLTIPAEHLDEAYRRMQDLNKPENDHLKRGGSFGPGKERVLWFSWMNGRYTDGECVDAADILDELRFNNRYDEASRTLRVIGFDGEKIGQEDLFFDAIADLVTPGSFVEWLGEDGARWRWVFDGQTRKEVWARMEWDD
jgi:hypothetical protein